MINYNVIMSSPTIFTYSSLMYLNYYNRCNKLLENAMVIYKGLQIVPLDCLYNRSIKSFL